MNKKKGWVSAYRSILDDPQYKDPDVLALWIHLLLRASYEDKTIKHNGKKIFIKKGSFITGRKSLSEATGVQESKVQRILKRWTNEHQIDQQTFSKYRYISITNWNEYQTCEQQNDASLNTINKLNNNIYSEIFSKPTVEEVKEYMAKMDLNESQVETLATGFWGYYESVGWVVGKNRIQMSNWRQSANNWIGMKKNENTTRLGSKDLDIDSTGWSRTN